MFSKDTKEATKDVAKVPSIISPGLRIVGDLVSEGNVQVDGVIEGDVKGKTIVIGEGGVVEGKIIGDSVTVAGTVEGTVEGMTLHIQSTARLTGDIIYEALQVDSGAVVDGRCSSYNGKRKFKPSIEKANTFELETVSEGKRKSEEVASGAI